MSIANIGSFAGGLMRGHLAATEEKRRQEEEARRKEDQAFQESQRKRAKDEWGREDSIRTGIAALPAAGSTQTRRVKNPQAILDTGDENQFMDEQYTYTPEMRQQALAGLYRQYGREDLAGLAEDRSQALLDRARTTRLNERTDRQTAAVDAALLKRSEMLRELATDEDAFVTKYGDMFNRDEFGGPQHQGARLAFASTPQGKVGYYIGADGAVGGQFPVNRQSLMEIVNRLTDAELSAASPEQFSAAQARGIQRGQLGVQQGQLAVQQQNANTTEQYRQWMQGRPTLTADGRGQIFVTDPQGGLIRTLGSRVQDPALTALTRPTVRTATLNVPDPATGKPSKVPVNVVTQMGANNVPVVRAYTMDGKQITDNKLLNQLAGGDTGGPDDTQLATFQALRQNVVNNTTLDPVSKMEQLKQIDAQQTLYILQRDIPKLGKDERVPELRKLLAGGVDRQILTGLGFTLSEMREAMKPEALSQTKVEGSAGGTATTPAAPANTTGALRNATEISDQEIARAFRENGTWGAMEALLGPRPTRTTTRAGVVGGSAEALKFYDDQWKAILDRRQGAMGGAGLSRP